MKANRSIGFTLVEIIIVVVILGILAAIVIPQFSSASTQARESYLVECLQNMRSQIELYQIQHNDLLPGEEGAGPNQITRKTTPERLIMALTNRTNAYGQIGNTPEHKYGPYIESIPQNPFATSHPETVQIDGEVGDGDCGWHLTTKGRNRGLFQADDAGYNLFTKELHSEY